MHFDNTPGMKATRREWIGLAVLALPTLLLAIDIGVLYLALPRLSADLGVNSAQQLWILDIYSFMLAGFLVTMGTLGDRIGRRKLLLIGGCAFGVASVVAAFSNGPEMLIASRALLGIAGATLMPSTMALIRNMFRDPKEMGTAIGVWFSCFMGGMVVGPLVGGVLLEHFWWGSAFLLGVPFMTALLIAGPALLPEYRDENAGRLDLASVALSLGAILPTIYGLKELARTGVQPVSLAALAAGVAIGMVFVRRQRTLTHPLLDLDLFRNRIVTSAMGIMLSAGIVMAGFGLMAALYLQTVAGLSPIAAGLLQVPGSLAMVLGYQIAPRLARRIPMSSLIAMGLCIAGAGLLTVTRVGASGGIELVVAGTILATFGISLPMALTINVLMMAAPPEKAGSVASLSETSGEFGIAVGVAALGSLGTFVYRTQLDLPATLPAEAAAAARESITAASIAAQHLPGPVGEALARAAGAAFTSGLTTVAGVGGLVFLSLAILTLTVLRERGTASVRDEASAIPAFDVEPAMS